MLETTRNFQLLIEPRTMYATLLAVVTATDVDWLIKPPTAKATFKRECWPEYKIAGQAPCGFALANGLTSAPFVFIARLWHGRLDTQLYH